MQFAFGKFDFYQSLEPPEEIRKICHVTKRQHNGGNVFTLTPKKSLPCRHILYLHGGAYVQNFTRQHWKFLSILVDYSNCTITAPDYPLAPKHTYLESFNMVMPLYKEIILQTAPSDVVLMGDSAGGGFALALAQKMLEEDVPQPGKIILLSPWLDITLENPEIKSIDPTDPFLGVRGLRKAASAYAGNTDPCNFMLSPVNGPLEQLGKISIFIGSKDIFVADTRKLNRLMEAKGIMLNYREYKDMVHVWMLLNFRESKQAREEIIKLICSDAD
jgi:acetyl esterase/lipase